MNNNYYFDDLHNILYMKNKEGYYEPAIIKCNLEKQEGIPMNKVPYLKALIEYVNFVRRQKNARDGSYRVLPLFVYQWSAIIDHIERVLNPKSERLLNSWSRQAGKSESIKIVIGFLMSYGRLFLDTKLERFNIVLASHDKKSVKKLYKEVKGYILKGVELFNSQFPNSKLITGEDNSKLESNDIKFEINRIIDEENLPYSQMFAITAQATNDSLSANLIIADEAGLIDNQSFEVSVTPFTTTTNGLLSMFGLPTHDASTLLFQNYLSETTIKIKRNWNNIYKLRLLTDREMAEGYKLDFLNRSKGKENSSYIRWNYYCDFEDSNGKFITRRILEQNKILNTELRTPLSTNENYIVMGVDIAPKRDYFCCTIGEVIPDKDDNYVCNVTYMQTLNKNKERVSKDKKVETIAEMCIRHKVDLLCIDSTSQGLWFVQDLVGYFVKNKIPTQIFMYSYAGSNKEALFGYLESNLFNEKLNLLKEEESWESKKLVEEMLLLIKKKSDGNNESIFYGAPKGDEFSDDHINSLALCNICFKYAKECDLNKKQFDDGQNLWRPKVKKFNTNNENNNKETISTWWAIPQ